MPTQNSHGFPYAQPDRPDELTEGIHEAEIAPNEDARHSESSLVKHGWNGNSSPVEAGRKGGKGKRGKTKLVNTMPDSSTLSEASKKNANALRLTLCRDLAKTVGGGVCGPGPSLMVKWSALSTALADEAFARGDDTKFKAFAESAAKHFIYAREACAKDAKARLKSNPRHALAHLWDDEEEK